MVTAQYSICGLRDRPEQLLVILQSELSDHQGSLVAAPLIPARLLKRRPKLNPLIRHGSIEYLLVVDKLGAVPVVEITHPLGSAESRREAISNALDYLFHGF